MRYMIDWSTSRLSDSRTYRKREDDGRSRRSDAWNNGSKGVSEIEAELLNNISFLIPLFPRHTEPSTKVCKIGCMRFPMRHQTWPSITQSLSFTQEL